MVQVHTRGLLQPHVRKQLADFGLSFPERTLPPISVRKWNERWRDKRMSRGSPTLAQRIMPLLFDPPLLYRKITTRVARLGQRA
jgi:hypothetical protein